MPMTVLSNDLGQVGMPAAVGALREGRSALDAVEEGIRRVEADTRVRHVGLGGDPNLLGEMEFDAAVMDGADRRAGSVGALKGYVHAIAVARAVMERLPHVMLVGDGAARFAAEIGEVRSETLTAEAREAHERWLAGELSPGDRDAWPDVPLAPLAWSAAGRVAGRDTVIFLAIDGDGNIAAGTSTSGWSYKHPGRLGDSPIVGAGLYADSRYGACACTHTGEMAVRACTAVSVVRAMERGDGVVGACREAALDLERLEGGIIGQVAIHALDADGRPCLARAHPAGDPLVYWYWTATVGGVERRTLDESD